MSKEHRPSDAAKETTETETGKELGDDVSEETKKKIGIYQKFNVIRTDGQSQEGRKHHECQYFVLDLDHDEFAMVALAAYAAACHEKYPALSSDLQKIVFGECAN